MAVWLVLLLVGSARADLSPVGALPPSSHSPAASCVPSADELSSGKTVDTGRPNADAVDFYWPSSPLTAAPPAPAGSTPAGAVRELPPLPGSAQLFLSAMLSMGAWQAFRSTRNWHWAALPDWYHSGGPIQIGHAVPFDLNFNAPPLCAFDSAGEQGGGDRESPPWRAHRDDRPRCRAQATLLQAAPRGPPVSLRQLSVGSPVDPRPAGSPLRH